MTLEELEIELEIELDTADKEQARLWDIYDEIEQKVKQNASFEEAAEQAYRDWDDALKVKSSFEVAILSYQELVIRKSAFEQSVEDALKVPREYSGGLFI